MYRTVIKCPRCGSKNVDEEDGLHKCMDCGKEFRVWVVSRRDDNDG